MTSRSSSTRPPARARGNRDPGEPNLVMLLADPEIRLLMRADGVDEKDLRTMLDQISVKLGGGGRAKGRGGKRRQVQTAKYRRGVGIMLVNARNEIFMARRNDVPGEVWQMPQGGIDRGETPGQAALRELKEEIGTNRAEIIAESKRWLYYDLPAELAQKAWHGRWRGQCQKWFVMRFTGKDDEINLATHHPEFDAWRWTTMQELGSLAVSFKKHLYATLLGEFAMVLGGGPKK